MQQSDLVQVYEVTVDKLTQHFVKAMMADHEFTQIVKVLISAGRSVLKNNNYAEIDQNSFELAIFKYAKGKWLDYVEKTIEPDEDKSIELQRASKAYDYIDKNQRSPKNWP